MKTFTVIAFLSIGLLSASASRAFAQVPGGYYPPPGQFNGYRPNPPFPPLPAPPPRTSSWVDGRGNRWLSVQRFVYVWNPRQGRWALRTTQELKALGANQLGRNDMSQPVTPGASPAAMNTNQLGQNGMSPPGYGSTAAMNANQLNPNLPEGMVGAPSAAMNANQLVPAGANFPPSGGPQFGAAGQPLFAENLGIYYEQVRYADGTFGARLTSAPMPGSPATQLPLDAGDVIFALDRQRFRTPDDVRNHRAQTTVDYIDSAAGRQSGVVNLP